MTWKKDLDLSFFSRLTALYLEEMFSLFKYADRQFRLFDLYRHNTVALNETTLPIRFLCRIIHKKHWRTFCDSTEILDDLKTSDPAYQQLGLPKPLDIRTITLGAQTQSPHLRAALTVHSEAFPLDIAIIKRCLCCTVRTITKQK